MLYSATDLAREFQIEPLTVGKIFASMYPSCKTRLNVGLRLKSTTRATSNTHYVVWYQDKWAYKEKARVLLKDYIKHFPHVVEAITASRSKLFDYAEVDAELRMCGEFVKAIALIEVAKDYHKRDRKDRRVR